MLKRVQEGEDLDPCISEIELSAPRDLDTHHVVRVLKLDDRALATPKEPKCQHPVVSLNRRGHVEHELEVIARVESALGLSSSDAISKAEDGCILNVVSWLSASSHLISLSSCSSSWTQHS